MGIAWKSSRHTLFGFSGDIETTQTLIDTLKSELDELQVDAHPETNELLRQLDTTTDYRIGAAS